MSEHHWLHDLERGVQHTIDRLSRSEGAQMAIQFLDQVLALAKQLHDNNAQLLARAEKAEAAEAAAQEQITSLEADKASAESQLQAALSELQTEVTSEDSTVSGAGSDPVSVSGGVDSVEPVPTV